MFTGIIEELGEVKRISKRANISLFQIQADKVLEGTKIGNSISLNGACLTVVEIEKNILSFEVINQTLNQTNLGKLRIGQKVNLERSLEIGGRLSGHFVTGHIDCLGIIRKKTYVNNNLCFEIAVPVEFIKYCIPKGSIAVDGISLTLGERISNTVTIYIIPHTFKNTTLGLRRVSDKVNIEFDILAKRVV